MKDLRLFYLGMRNFRREDLTAVFKCLKSYHVEGLDIFCIAPGVRTKTNGVNSREADFVTA